jgi:hypothetical protein
MNVTGSEEFLKIRPRRRLLVIPGRLMLSGEELLGWRVFVKIRRSYLSNLGQLQANPTEPPLLE